MSDEIITGKIYFSRVPSGRELKDFIAFITCCAIENQIWINTGDQIRNPDARYKYSIDNKENNAFTALHLPFEITDEKDTYECNRITSGIWYSDTGSGIADWGSSGIPNIERFLVLILNHDLIGHVQLSIELLHGYIPSEYANLDINASDFCKTLMSLPNYNAVPTVQFNIR